MDDQNKTNQPLDQSSLPVVPSVPLDITPPVTPEPIAPPTTTFTTTVTTPTPTPSEPIVAPAEPPMPEVKHKSRIMPIIGGIMALLLVVGVAGAAYYVSNQLATRQAVAPNAPTSKPAATGCNPGQPCSEGDYCGTCLDGGTCEVVRLCSTPTGGCTGGQFYCGGCISACRNITTETCQDLINAECGGGGDGGGGGATACTRDTGSGGAGSCYLNTSQSNVCNTAPYTFRCGMECCNTSFGGNAGIACCCTGCFPAGTDCSQHACGDGGGGGTNLCDTARQSTADKYSMGSTDSVTLTSYTNDASVTQAWYAVYNMDNLYPAPPDNNPRPVCVAGSTNATDQCPNGGGVLMFEGQKNGTTGTLTLRYAQIFDVIDTNTGQKPLNVSFSAYFSKPGVWSSPSPQCVIRTVSASTGCVPDGNVVCPVCPTTCGTPASTITCKDSCGVDKPGSCLATAVCACVPVWVPDPGTVCLGEKFEQTSNCPDAGVKLGEGTKDCGCTEDWHPPFEGSLECAITCMTQTRCKVERNTCGTKEPVWTPDPGTVCIGTNFEQTSDCGGTREVAGTKVCADVGACMLISVYKKVDGVYGTTSLTTTQLQALKIGDVLKFSLTSSMDNLRGRFRVTVAGVAGSWLNGTIDATNKKLVTYSDYTVGTAGTYKFEGQVSITP